MGSKANGFDIKVTVGALGFELKFRDLFQGLG